MDPALIKQVCLKLRNAAPSEWGLFCSMIEAYTLNVIDAVTDADASNIMVAKGRAQQCKAFLRAFTECDQQPASP